MKQALQPKDESSDMDSSQADDSDHTDSSDRQTDTTAKPLSAGLTKATEIPRQQMCENTKCYHKCPSENKSDEVKKKA